MRYPVVELQGAKNREPTFQNSIDSDGMRILYFTDFQCVTEQTVAYSVCRWRPYRLAARHDIRVLNVAGPRHSKAPRASA